MKYIQDNIKIFDKYFNLDKKEINRKVILIIYSDDDLYESIISQISEIDFYNIYSFAKDKGMKHDDILDKMCEKHLIKRFENKKVKI